MEPRIILDLEECTGPIVQGLFKVEGMTCSGCADTLDRHLGSLRGVASRRISFVTSRLELSYYSDVLTESEIISHIKLLQFQAQVMSSGIPLILVYPSHRQPEYHQVVPFLSNYEGILSVKEAVNHQTKENILEIAYDQDVIGSRQVLKVLEDRFLLLSFSPRPQSYLKTIELQNNDLVAKWRTAFFFSLICSIPLAISAFILMQVDEIEDIYMQPLFRGLPIRYFVEFLLASPLQLYFAIPIYQSAWGALRYAGAFDMDSLIAISTSVAYFYSVGILIAVLILGGTSTFPLLEEVFFETSGILLTLIFLGRYLEVLAKRNTADAVSALFKFQTPTAVLMSTMHDEGTTIPAELIQRNDLLKVLPGSKIPADAMVVGGSSFVDESLLTGESTPLTKTVGSNVIAGSINQHGMMVIKVTKIPGETVIDDIMEALQKTQMRRAPLERITDMLASKFVPFVLITSLSVFVLWFLLAYYDVVDADGAAGPFALHFALAVLIVSCPCALGLAAPVPVLVGTEVAAKNHLLFKGGDILEISSKVEVVCFDKTGTLTTGKLVVTDILPTINQTAEVVLFHAACAEIGSEHSIAKAVLYHAKQNLSGPAFESILESHDTLVVPGRGVQSSYKGSTILVGNAEFMMENGVDTGTTSSDVNVFRHHGKTILFVASGTTFLGCIAVHDQLRDNAIEVIQELSHQGYEVRIISGDHPNTCQYIGSKLGVASHLISSGVTPKEKAQIIQKLQQQERKVMMVGDGINDAVALGQADVGMVVGSASDISLDVADVAMMHDNLHLVLVALDLSKRVYNVIKWNIGWAITYNMIALPIAAGVLQYPWEISIPPVIAGLNELLSSLPVIGFSLLFLRTYHAPSPPPAFTGVTVTNEKTRLLV